MRVNSNQWKGANAVSIEYFRDELIDILKKRDFSKLAFCKLNNGFPYANCFLYTTGTSADEDEAFANGTPDSVEVSVHTPDNQISVETADRMIDVLEHLEECIQRAYDWLSKQDLPYAWLLQEEYPMCQLHFGVASVEPHSKKKVGGGFSLIFDMPGSEDNPWHCDVWFHYNDLQPYKSIKDLW